MQLQENDNECLGEIDQPSTIYLAFGKYLRRSENTITKYVSNIWILENDLKREDDLSPLLLNLVLECAVRNVQETNLGLDMNGTHQMLVYVDDVNLIRDDIRTIEKRRYVIKCL